VFNATFNNISAISWRPVLVVEEAGVPGENIYFFFIKNHDIKGIDKKIINIA
jgi:hypothetical protein